MRKRRVFDVPEVSLVAGAFGKGKAVDLKASVALARHLLFRRTVKGALVRFVALCAVWTFFGCTSGEDVQVQCLVVVKDKFDGDNGARTSRINFTYDVLGNLVLEEIYRVPSGELTRRYVYTSDDNGNRKSLEQDNGGDGVVERREVFSYDDKNNLTAREIDRDGDGAIDARELSTYSSSQSLSEVEFDLDADGVSDQIKSYMYSTDGDLLATETVDVESLRIVETETYQYLEDGKVRREHDDGSSLPPTISVSTYNAQNLLVEFVCESEGAYLCLVKHTLWSYDAYGNETLQRSDADNDGVMDFVIASAYECS